MKPNQDEIDLGIAIDLGGFAIKTAISYIKSMTDDLPRRARVNNATLFCLLDGAAVAGGGAIAELVGEAPHYCAANSRDPLVQDLPRIALLTAYRRHTLFATHGAFCTADCILWALAKFHELERRPATCDATLRSNLLLCKPKD